MPRSRCGSTGLGALLPVAALVVAACGNPSGGAVPATAGTATTTLPPVSVTSTTVTIPTETAPTGTAPSLDGATLLAPVEGLVNVHRTPWQRVTGTGRDLVVHWTTTGLAPCSLLARLDLAETPATITITISVGEVPGVRCGVDPQLGLPLAARVTLAADRGSRTVVDGAR